MATRLLLMTLIGVWMGLQTGHASAGVERHDPFLRCIILLAIAEETPGPENAAALRTVGEILTEEAIRIRTEEADGNELLDRYVVVLKQIQQEEGLAWRPNRDEAIACARDQGVDVTLPG